ncbi:hypothetical protein [Sphingomonas sp.]
MSTIKQVGHTGGIAAAALGLSAAAIIFAQATASAMVSLGELLLR